MSIAAWIDLNTLDSLSRTCRQIRADVLQYRKMLLVSTLHCSNEHVPVDPQTTMQFRARATNLWYMEDARRPKDTKAGECARDMVSECRRCGTVVCRVWCPAPFLLPDLAPPPHHHHQYPTLTCTPELRHQASGAHRLSGTAPPPVQRLRPGPPWIPPQAPHLPGPLSSIRTHQPRRLPLRVPRRHALPALRARHPKRRQRVPKASLPLPQPPTSISNHPSPASGSGATNTPPSSAVSAPASATATAASPAAAPPPAAPVSTAKKKPTATRPTRRATPTTSATPRPPPSAAAAAPWPQRPLGARPAASALRPSPTTARRARSWGRGTRATRSRGSAAS